MYQQTSHSAMPAATPTPGRWLQRKCACGTHAPGGAECADCAKKRLRRSARDAVPAPAVPQLVRDVLASPGRSLEPATRQWMEPRFGSDFSRVRVHDDGHAAASARAVGALAYAVGSHVVFDTRQYAPHMPAGRRLLAHELAHTLQDPGAGGLHASLAIGSPGDAAETAADRAADAVMRGERASVSPGGSGVVRRQMRGCAASAGDSPDVREVHCPDGSDYRVTMTAVDGPRFPGFHGSVTPGASLKEIWLDISLCKGNIQVNLQPGVDIPKALGSVVANMVTGADALKGVALNPGLKITFIQGSSFTVSLTPSVKLDEKGVAGAGGSVEVQTPDVTVKGGASCDPRAGSCMFTLDFSGGATTKNVDCTKKGKQKLTFACEKITHVPAVPEVPALTQTDEQTRYVFFRHARHEVRKDFRLPTDIQALNEQGYRVTEIKGFTSPEGPRGAEHAPQFEGNEALAIERAQAARDWLAEPKVCADCDLSGARQSGESELPPKQGRQEPEPKGPDMERGAVDEFLGKQGTPDPLAPADPAARARFQRQPFGKQREQAYELMRRAAIVLERSTVVREKVPGVPARDDPAPVECPSGVLEAAQKSFGIKTPGPFNFDTPGKP
ncbi:MAG TPA: DUF4157 domain-containing protein [Rhodanobacter sp.]|nr:DUF4157 domain-containing protein [Rhodanobacter sp.]